ncbi:hypothetical protein NA78x_001049 [Anatilimnocola sp. NA78]|uniref:hypothetical protein n=1 Tax=Anatilimnocola sp. NA78 TaxID=3415683 RepID=UPI003CE58811
MRLYKLASLSVASLALLTTIAWAASAVCKMGYRSDNLEVGVDAGAALIFVDDDTGSQRGKWFIEPHPPRIPLGGLVFLRAQDSYFSRNQTNVTYYSCCIPLPLILTVLAPVGILCFSQGRFSIRQLCGWTTLLMVELAYYVQR